MAAIGVFDSGVGGLTVLRRLREQWPHENFVYLADTARLPYGNKSLSTVHRYVEQCLQFLQPFSLQAVVVACNTASAALIEAPIAFPLPVFNVVEPGARKAAQLSAQKRIGVMATRATVQAEAYPRAILRLEPLARVHQHACPLWVPLVEEGLVRDLITTQIVERDIQALFPHQVDALILGCTHYPALRETIAAVAGPEIALVDSATGLIEDMERALPSLTQKNSAKGSLRLLATDRSPRLLETARLLLEDPSVEEIELVDL